MRIFSLYLALQLLVSFLNCEGCMKEEREALLQIKDSINSPEGTAFSSWYGEDCCQWEGLICNVSTSRVIKIFFHHRRSQGMEAWYPNATLFTHFEDLQELYLPGNQIGGFTSPNALNKLKNLQKLDLRDNLIDNSSHLCWGHIPTLYHLDLSTNKLQGYIPKCICESQSLTELILFDNSLGGNVDACLGNMTSIRHLDLSDNLFNGTFPSLQVQNLTNIQSFVISNNQFKDVISFSIFANLSKLNYLDISLNPDLEIETESPTWSPSFSLNHLDLRSCNLNKRSGRNIPRFLSLQYRLESVDLSNTSLVGSFPYWLIYNISSELWIRGNNLTGSFPRSQRNKSSQLTTLDISDNMLYGPFPEGINLTFPELYHLNASQNMFTSTILQSLSEMRQLQFLDLSNNNLQGEIPDGIFSNLISLEYLKLSNNKLQGELFSRNSSLPNLRWLYLDRNSFAGSLLDSLTKFSHLQILSIKDNDISGDLSKRFPILPQLRALVLRGNRFRGSIPFQLCQMKHLDILDLSENDLSGEIPTCLDNITSWTEKNFELESDSWPSIDFKWIGREYTFRGEMLNNIVKVIDISLNKLTGPIPIQLSELRQIMSLNVSHNLFSGQIPEYLGNLMYLESLDLSYNEFSGNFPHNLTSLTSLAVFNVAFNNLSGPLLPLVGQFATFDSSSYLGNPNLCGFPLEKECETVEDKSGGKRNEKTLTDKSGGKRNEKTLTEIMGMSFLMLWYSFFMYVEYA